VSHRVVIRSEVKRDWHVKPVDMEGLRKCAPIREFITEDCKQLKPCEIAIFDPTVSLYGIEPNFRSLQIAVDYWDGPISFGGGIDTLDKANQAFFFGADRVLINTGLYKNLDLAKQVSDKYGRQSVIGQIDCRPLAAGGYGVYVEAGRTRISDSVITYLDQLPLEDIGELLVTDISRDGVDTRYNFELAELVVEKVDIPVVLSGGRLTNPTQRDLDDVHKVGLSGISIDNLFDMRRDAHA
jgi:imidazole glycerol phosphate synthase subunit HisF